MPQTIRLTLAILFVLTIVVTGCRRGSASASKKPTAVAPTAIAPTFPPPTPTPKLPAYLPLSGDISPEMAKALTAAAPLTPTAVH